MKEKHKFPEPVKQHLRSLKSIAYALSDDINTQVSVVLSGKDGFVYGANRLPNNVKNKLYRVDRPHKRDWIEHAEINAIANAAGSGLRTDGSTLFMDWFPCNMCAKTIISAGVKTIYCRAKQALESDEKVMEQYRFDISYEMLTEAGIELIEWEDKDVEKD